MRKFFSRFDGVRFVDSEDLLLSMWGFGQTSLWVPSTNEFSFGKFGILYQNKHLLKNYFWALILCYLVMLLTLRKNLSYSSHVWLTMKFFILFILKSRACGERLGKFIERNILMWLFRGLFKAYGKMSMELFSLFSFFFPPILRNFYSKK